MKQLNKRSRSRSEHIQRLLDTPQKLRAHRLTEAKTIVSIFALIAIAVLIGTRILEYLLR